MPKQQNYRQLKKVWYKKLAQSGFIDIETKSGLLKGGSTSSKFNNKTSRATQTAKQQYYYMANELLNTHTFDSELDKAIWAYHAEGISVRDIAKILKKLPLKRSFSNRTSVWLIVKKYGDIIRNRVK